MVEESQAPGRSSLVGLPLFLSGFSAEISAVGGCAYPEHV